MFLGFGTVFRPEASRRSWFWGRGLPRQNGGGAEVSTVAVSGYYGFGNTGDEAVLAGIVSSFAEKCPNANLVALSADPEATRKLHSIRAVSRTGPGEVYRTLREADMLISGGGSLLQDVTSSRSLAYYLGLIWLAKRLGKNVMVYGQGIGPITARASRQSARSILNRVDLITVRDGASKAYLSELGVTRPEVVVTADASFAMEPATEAEADEILRSAGAPDDMPLIGVSIRPWKEQVHWLPALAHGLDSAAAKIGAALVLVPMQRDQDLGVCLQVASQMTSPAVVVSSQITPAQMMSVLGRMSLVVGMRLHSLIFAASMGVPIVGVTYDPKVEAFVRASAQEEGLKIEGLTAEDVIAKVQSSWEVRDDISARVTEQARGFRESAQRNAELACDLIG